MRERAYPAWALKMRAVPPMARWTPTPPRSFPMVSPVFAAEHGVGVEVSPSLRKVVALTDRPQEGRDKNQ